LTAIVNSYPLFASATHVDFVCRDAANNWWLIVDTWLLKTDPFFNFIGVIPGSPGAVVEIVELTTAAAAALRSRHEAAPGAVWAEVTEVRALRGV